MSSPLMSSPQWPSSPSAIRHDLERREVERVIDFLPRDEPLALAGDRIAEAVFFPRQERRTGRPASGSSACVAMPMFA